MMFGRKNIKFQTEFSEFFANDQLDTLFYIFIYYTSLHVSSITSSHHQEIELY